MLSSAPTGTEAQVTSQPREQHGPMRHCSTNVLNKHKEDAGEQHWPLRQRDPAERKSKTNSHGPNRALAHKETQVPSQAQRAALSLALASQTRRLKRYYEPKERAHGQGCPSRGQRCK